MRLAMLAVGSMALAAVAAAGGNAVVATDEHVGASWVALELLLNSGTLSLELDSIYRGEGGATLILLDSDGRAVFRVSAAGEEAERRIVVQSSGLPMGVDHSYGEASTLRMRPSFVTPIEAGRWTVLFWTSGQIVEWRYYANATGGGSLLDSASGTSTYLGRVTDFQRSETTHLLAPRIEYYSTPSTSKDLSVSGRLVGWFGIYEDDPLGSYDMTFVATHSGTSQTCRCTFPNYAGGGSISGGVMTLTVNGTYRSPAVPVRPTLVYDFADVRIPWLDARA